PSCSGGSQALAHPDGVRGVLHGPVDRDPAFPRRLDSLGWEADGSASLLEVDDRPAELVLVLRHGPRVVAAGPTDYRVRPVGSHVPGYGHAARRGCRQADLALRDALKERLVDDERIEVEELAR